MNLIRVVLFSVIFLVGGCSSTGGTFAGLIPLPKFLKGKVQDSIYHAEDGSFRVRTPFAEGTYAYQYMEVKEQYSDVGAYVSFNSSVYPNEIYRIEIGKKLDKSQPSPAFEDLVGTLLQGYKKQLAGYGGEVIEKWRSETTLNGKRAMIVTLEQLIPRPHYADKSIQHIIYIVESPNGGGGVIWVQWPHGCSPCSKGPEIKIRTGNKRIKSFIESFELNI